MVYAKSMLLVCKCLRYCGVSSEASENSSDDKNTEIIHYETHIVTLSCIVKYVKDIQEKNLGFILIH